MLKVMQKDVLMITMHAYDDSMSASQPCGATAFSIHCTVPSILFFVFNHTVFTLSRVWQCHFTRTTSDDPLAGEIAMSKELKD
jgi:hypothetical protein